MKEKGLFVNPHEYKSREDIDKRGVYRITPFTRSKSFDDWGNIFLRRQQERQESFNIPETVEIKIDSHNPILLVPFGDVHAGGGEVDYHRFVNDVNFVASTKGAYALTIGDMTDSFFWGGSAGNSEIGSFEEQTQFIQKGLMLLAKKNKLLASWGGDHDGWMKERGPSMYRQFEEQTQSYYLEGPSYIKLWVGKQLYKISGAHKHNGFSIYNHAHSAIRLYNDDALESDICMTAHTHQKALCIQPVKRFGGETDVVHFLSLGAYKQSDDYLRKKGFHRLKDGEIGAHALLLSPFEKNVQVFWSVQEGIQRV